jgi:1-acyl-sn-glycerol-3-phosphate acyltransferase
MRLARTVTRAVVSLTVWGVGFTWMLFTASITLVLLAIGLPYQRVHVWFTAPTFRWTVWSAAIRLRVHYHPDFDPEERSVFCQNHINLFDGHVASAAIPHAFSGLMNAWQFKIPIYGWLMTMSKGIPVRKQRRDKIIDDISTEARKRKEIGMSVLTFPEGHRTRTGRPGQFKRGVFLMARNAGMSVVPIAVRGLYEANNKNTGWLFEPFKTVDVFVGPQFSTAGLDNEQVGDLADRLRTWIDDCLRIGDFPATERSEPKTTAA